MKSYHKIIATLAAAAFSLTLLAGDVSAATRTRHHRGKGKTTNAKVMKHHRSKKSSSRY